MTAPYDGPPSQPATKVPSHEDVERETLRAIEHTLDALRCSIDALNETRALLEELEKSATLKA